MCVPFVLSEHFTKTRTFTGFDNEKFYPELKSEKTVLFWKKQYGWSPYSCKLCKHNYHLLCGGITPETYNNMNDLGVLTD